MDTEQLRDKAMSLYQGTLCAIDCAECLDGIGGRKEYDMVMANLKLSMLSYAERLEDVLSDLMKINLDEIERENG